MRLYLSSVCVCVAPWEVTFQKWSGHSEWCPFLERCIQEMSWFLGFFPSSWSLIIWTRVVLPTLPSCAKDVSKVGNCIVMWPFNGWARENTRSTRIHSKPNLTWPPRQQKPQKDSRFVLIFYPPTNITMENLQNSCFNIVIFWVHPPTIFYSGQTIYSTSFVWRGSLPKFHFLLLQTWAVGSQVTT